MSCLACCFSDNEHFVLFSGKRAKGQGWLGAVLGRGKLTKSRGLCVALGKGGGKGVSQGKEGGREGEQGPG